MNHRKHTFDNEEIVLSYYRSSENEILAFPIGENIEMVYQATHNEEEWIKWINSSGKADKTPDFYNIESKLMMEVMRMDDHAIMGKNDTLKEENDKLIELKKTGILDKLPENIQIVVNASTDLKTYDDHNFKRFRQNFARVIEKHSKQVIKYRNNHPGYKLIFFIFDETDGLYMEPEQMPDNVFKGLVVSARPHMYFADELMVNAIKKSNADFIIWYKPFMYFDVLEERKFDIPSLVIYEVEKMKIKTIIYDENNMISSEI